MPALFPAAADERRYVEPDPVVIVARSVNTGS
jgi:hypothetical protein